MRDRFGDEIEPIEEELPAEIQAPEEEPDEEPEGPPDEYMTGHCESCDENGVRLNGLGRCDHIDYASIARRHVQRIKAMLKKETR
jgi:hypothetical protein